MKKIYAITLFLSIAFFGHAQLDTSFQHTTVAYGQLENQQLVDAKRHYLQLQKDEKYLFKLGFEGMTLPRTHSRSSLQNLPLANSLFLEFEHRFKTGFSINAQLNYNRATSYTIPQIRSSLAPYITHHYGFHIEPRWYFQKRQQITNQASGNNLSGLYLSLLAGVKYWQKPYPGPGRSDGKLSFLKGNYQYSTFNLGWQRRFSKYGFLHLELGTGLQHIPQKNISVSSHGYTYEIEPLARWQWLTSYKVGIGLVVGNKSDSSIKNNIWRYHQADTDMWKIDLFGLLSALGKEGVGGKINLGYEKSIKQSAFSISTNLLYLHLPSWISYYKRNQLSIQIAPRYYYNLNKRMQKGKTANNLSANYFSIRSQWNIKMYNDFWQEKVDFSFLWGIQRRLFEQMFINYELGYDFPSAHQFEGVFISELKIGLAF